MTTVNTTTPTTGPTSLIAREQAAKINPIISLVGMPDTLSQCAGLIDQLGLFMANAQPEDGAPLVHLLTGTISAAINFELEVSHG